MRQLDPPSRHCHNLWSSWSEEAWGRATWEAEIWSRSGFSEKRHQHPSRVSWGHLYPQDVLGGRGQSHTEQRQGGGGPRGQTTSGPAFGIGQTLSEKSTSQSSYTDPKGKTADQATICPRINVTTTTEKTVFRGLSDRPTHCKASLKKNINDHNQIKLVRINEGGSEPHKSPQRGADCMCSETSVFKENYQGICPKATSPSPIPCHNHAHVWWEFISGFTWNFHTSVF